jgi:ATP/ADP translocase/HEAT repeat protein
MIRALRTFWRTISDIRKGEGARLAFMALYLLSVLFAYYIIKTASTALFLNKFDIDKLPILQMLIAGVGGLVAYVYTKIAVQASLKRAVTWTMAIAVACLIAFWALIPDTKDPRTNKAFADTMLYLFSIWTSMFSIVTVSQGWLVAANVFHAREAKRLYGPLGLSAVVGAWMGGEFAGFSARALGTRNLLWGSVVMVIIAYVAFRMVIVQRGVSLARARAAEAEPETFAFREIPTAIRRHRHLQVIIGMMLLMFMVDSILNYQFSAQAKASYSGDHLTAFIGTFYGRYLNWFAFTLQFFFTVPLVRAVGVGGTLQAMPVTMAAVSVATYAAPGIWTTSIARLSEAGTRYTVNRTGMELLYVPLPADLKNRTKAFVDIFIDRFGRGLGGLLLVLLTWANFSSTRQIAIATVLLSVGWILVAGVARREYVRTVRRRLEARRLDFENLRIDITDPTTIGLLEQALQSPNPRQAGYALSLLADAKSYVVTPKLRELARHPSPEVRAQVYETARREKFDGVIEPALTEVWGSSPGQEGAIKPAVAYILSQSADATRLTRLFLDHPNWVVAEGALEALQRESAEDFVTQEWLAVTAADEDRNRRAIAALAIGVRGDQGTEVLFKLLDDPDPKVVAAACRAAGSVQNRAYLPALVRRLTEPRLRAAAVEALAAYGSRICGSLGDILQDEQCPIALRRQIPRVLRLIPEQRSVSVLLDFVGHPDLTVRQAVLKALNRLRNVAPHLDFGTPVVTRQILEEARYYFQLLAALVPFNEDRRPRTASSLLARTLEERLRQTLERLFRLLGLRYPPQQIYAAYLAVNRRRSEEYAAALEFLDNVMDRELKRVILPLLDSAAHDPRVTADVEPLTAEAAIRELIRDKDPWLKACAIAAAAEHNLRGLSRDISEAAEQAGDDVTQVARSAVAVLDSH